MSNTGQITIDTLVLENSVAFIGQESAEVIINQLGEGRIGYLSIEILMRSVVASITPGKKAVITGQGKANDSGGKPTTPPGKLRDKTVDRKNKFMSVGRILPLSAVIASGASLSSSVRLEDNSIVAIATPGAITGSTITFQASLDNSTFNNVYKDDGSEYSPSIGTSRQVPIDPTYFMGARFVKIRTGTAASPSTQSGAVTVTVISREL